jgi:putative hydrolase of the HAD superfamily
VYRHLFFDLDHTLWDYESNSNRALARLYEEFRLSDTGIPGLAEFQSAFHRANHRVWNQFGENTLNRHQLRHKRLELVYESFGLEAVVPDGFHEAYYEQCSRGTDLMPHAREVVEILSGRYVLHIVTNGFDDAQFTKIENSGLAPYFQTITTSENAGSKKPERAYFAYALQKAGARKAESMVIGDGLQTDIRGARDFGLDFIWFNPEGTAGEEIPFIRSLRELPGMLQGPTGGTSSGSRTSGPA